MKMVYSATPYVVERDRQKQAKRLAKKRETPAFRELLHTMRKKISSGKTLAEIREDLGIKKDQEWDDLKCSLALSFANTESMYLEFLVKQQTVYQLAADFTQKAKDREDHDNVARGIMMLLKAQESNFEMSQALGLIKPIVDPLTGGEGYSSEDVENARQRYDKIIQERILSKLESERYSEQPVPLQLLSGPEPERSADQLGEAALADSTAEGPKP